MSILGSIAAVLLTVATVVPPQAPQGAPALPEAVFTHPAAQDDLSLQTPPSPRWSQQALSQWAGPWESQGPRARPDSYDHRYITW